MRKDKRESYKKKIINLLNSRPDQIYKSRDLVKLLRVSNQDYQVFKKLAGELYESGEIARHKGNRYGKIRKAAEASGILHVKTQGYGFIVRDDDGEDIFISQKSMGSAVHGDRVRVQIWAQHAGRLPEGRILEVLERKQDRIVGTFQEARSFNYVIPDELKMTRDIWIHEKNRGQAQPGQKVVVEILQWGDGRKMPEGKIKQVLGRPDQPGVDVLSVIHGKNLPLDFPQKVKAEAKKISSQVPDSKIEGRLDFRDRLVFTIDPEDAKDYDDAVSLERLKSGNWLLGVHISDVSTYVRAGSALDREAMRRGTSVYLVDRVIPMFPENLSSEICSLHPQENRLTFSILLELTSEGFLENYELEESVICSQYRLNYREVQKMINWKKKEALDNGQWPMGEETGDRGSGIGNWDLGSGTWEKRPDKDIKLNETLFEMYKLSQILKKRWRDEGMIDFEAPEAEVILDTEGFPVDIRIRERLESHELIESFMLLANRTVAEHILKLREEREMKLPFVYRIHERPQGKKLDDFVRFVRAMGHGFDPGKRISSKKFQSLLKEVKGTPHEVVIEEIALRTMMKAVYSTKNPGHFGLSFKHYTHFTSPIRRYPDLVVHRLLKKYLFNTTDPNFAGSKLSEICETATQMEIRAQEAERESIKAKQAVFMADKIGETFEGIISGVTPFGIFAEIPRYLVEGLIHVNDLSDDYYVYDEKHYCLVGQNRGDVFRLGDPIQFQLIHVSIENRKIDFILVRP
jgi:ribonuclease R